MEPLCKEKDDAIECHAHPRYIWLMMVHPVVAVLTILVILNFAYVLPETRDTTPWLFTADVLALELIFAAAILIPCYIWIWLDYVTFIYVIKKDELVIRKGILRKRHNSIPYNKIRNAQRVQSILERVFGLCTISIETSDVSLEFPDTAIPGMLNSRELVEMILKKTHADQEAQTNLGETMREILSQLKDLNEKGRGQKSIFGK